MSNTNKHLNEYLRYKVYRSKRWKDLRKYVILRDKSICYFCGKLVSTHATVHHKEELNELNFTDERVAYDPTNLVCCHQDCHNIHHERFGYKKSIVNDDLSIDYSKRKEN